MVIITQVVCDNSGTVTNIHIVDLIKNAISSIYYQYCQSIINIVSKLNKALVTNTFLCRLLFYVPLIIQNRKKRGKNIVIYFNRNCQCLMKKSIRCFAAIDGTPPAQ